MNREEFEAVLGGPVEEAAKRLLGSVIERQYEDVTLRAKIVETEAYHELDPASHAVTGPTGRAKTMFKSAGHLYVYFTYGMHYCSNITAGQPGEGAGVLIRAVEPLAGYEEMIYNRGGREGVLTTNGPGKTCQALGIDRSFDGHDLAESPIQLHLCDPVEESGIVATTRIGISKAVDTPWRFYLKDNPYVSRK